MSNFCFRIAEDAMKSLNAWNVSLPSSKSPPKILKLTASKTAMFSASNMQQTFKQVNALVGVLLTLLDCGDGCLECHPVLGCLKAR